MSLARQIVLDGEGATKMVEVKVIGAPGAGRGRQSGSNYS